MTIDEAAAAGGEGAGKTFADPIPAALLDTPLEYILVDHVRQRSLCAAFRRFTLQGYIDRAEADAVVAYLRRDVDLHHRTRRRISFRPCFAALRWKTIWERPWRGSSLIIANFAP